jgi:predicted AAA+ superfamily ATPase
VLKRKVVSELIDWKNNHKNKCLLVIGARQIGKTFIIREFAKENYDSFYEINFLENEKQKEIFKDDLSVDNIIKEISLRIPTFKVDDGKTLLFLDEIQECPQAITALKFLAQDKRFDCIASGSMLGMAYKRTSSFPVGYIDRIYMNSLDFEEFLWAKGVTDETINYIKEFYDNKKQVNMFAHNGMLELFREYIVLGGMPEVINEFLASNNFNVALNIQKEILDGYRDDIIKYAPEDEKVKIRACFDSIPVQLAKDNKKFKYNLVQKKADKNKLFNSLEWLYDAGIINFCYNLRNPEAPFEGNKIIDSFKVYMKDTGLLMAMMDEGSQLEIMNGNLGIYKGAIYENIIADVFNKSGKKLYYFEKNSTLEIDFFIRYNNEVTAVEVKSADNTKSKSLNSIMNNYGVKQGIKLSTKNIGYDSNGVLSLPLYMSMFL